MYNSYHSIMILKMLPIRLSQNETKWQQLSTERELHLPLTTILLWQSTTWLSRVTGLWNTCLPPLPKGSQDLELVHVHCSLLALLAPEFLKTCINSSYRLATWAQSKYKGNITNSQLLDTGELCGKVTWATCFTWNRAQHLFLSSKSSPFETGLM